MLRFSIIIPVYNVETYLEQCIMSVIGQSYVEFEAILIDDGSIDSSGEICDRYAKHDIRLKVIHTQNEGLSVARNTGITRAQGEYIVLLDADDYLDLKALENIQNVLCGGDYDLIVNSIDRYDEKNNRIYPCRYQFAEGDFKEKCSWKIYKELLYKKEFTFTAWVFVTKRKFLLDNNLMFYPKIFHEDELWTPYVVLKAKRIAYNNEHFYYYRVNRKDSIMNGANIEREFSLQYIMEQLLKDLGQEKYDLNEKKLLQYRAADVYITLLFNLGDYQYDNRFQELIYSLEGKQKVLLYHKNFRSWLIEKFITIFGLKCFVFFVQCKKNRDRMKTMN